MRLIGHLTDENSARAFADYLYVQGIENQLEQENDGWSIWISDEDKITSAADILTAFRQNPTDPKYTKEAKSAAELRAQEQKDKDSYRKRVRNRRHLFRPVAKPGPEGDRPYQTQPGQEPQRPFPFTPPVEQLP